MEIYPSSVVKSIAGRDKGNYFVVIEKIDDAYVSICDGDMRRVENPKKKKLKHLRPVGTHIRFISEKLQAGEQLTNSLIKKSLADEISRINGV